MDTESSPGRGSEFCCSVPFLFPGGLGATLSITPKQENFQL